MHQRSCGERDSVNDRTPLAPNTISKDGNPQPVKYLAKEVETVPNKIQPHNDDPSLPLYTLEQIPYHLAENKYILTGYRMGYNTIMCFRSVFALHNETFNIWTHLLGYIAFLVAICALFGLVLIPSNHSYKEGATTASDVSKGPKWLTLLIFGVYSFGCLMCMVCSALFHTLIPHESMTVFGWAHALDYFGITVLVVGSFLPFCYFCFSCEPFWRWTYIIMISTFGVIGILGPFFRQWTEQQYQKPKVLFYVCMVGSGIFPIIHIYVLLPGSVASPYVNGLLLMMSLYGVGVFVYAFKIPEYFFPGKFDIYLSSHQIWHVFVLAAAFVHFFNCASMYVNFNHMPSSC